MDIRKTAENITNTRKKKLILAAAAVIIVVIAAAYIAISSMGTPADPESQKYITITIESGSGTAQISETLTENGIIDSSAKFRLWSRIKGYDSQYKAGVYSLSPSMDFKEIAEILVGGKVSTVKFTIPEGYTIYQVADTLSQLGYVDKDRFIQILETGDFTEEYPFLKDAQDNKNRLEGYLYPNTYFVETGASEEAYIKVMLDQFGKEVTEEHYARAEELGLSMNDVIIIASIIQRECDVAKEGDKVASVIYNRLEKGMALQMCSTVQYILGETKPVLSYADTQIESPYNTYLHQGLPPGPICSPSIDAIEAALYPADTDYLYFVLSEKLDGTSNFSDNYEEFQKDSQAYYDAYEKVNS